MKNRRGQLTGDLVHIRDHQKQSLGGREGGGERAGLERAMDGSRRAALRLHFHHSRDITPDVLPAIAGPGVRLLRHGGTWRDRVDGNHFVGAIGHGSDCIITICSYHRHYLFIAHKAAKAHFRSNGKKSNRGFERGFIAFVWRAINRQAYPASLFASPVEITSINCFRRLKTIYFRRVIITHR